MDAAAAALIDRALEDAGISSKELADLLGVSRSLVDRWRSGNYREAPSFTQVLRFPVAFHIHLHRGLNKRFGFGRAALAQLLEATGVVAAFGVE